MDELGLARARTRARHGQTIFIQGDVHHNGARIYGKQLGGLVYVERYGAKIPVDHCIRKIIRRREIGVGVGVEADTKTGR